MEVIRGPLQGVKGRLVREAGLAVSVLSISLIQRAVSIEIDAASASLQREPIGIFAANVEDGLDPRVRSIDSDAISIDEVCYWSSHRPAKSGLF